MSISEQAALRFERITREHIAQLLPIEHEAYPDPWTQGMFRQEIESRNSHFYILHLGEEIVGYGGFWLILDEAHVTKVTVAEAHRGQGYGRRLMEYLLERSAWLGGASIRLEVREQNEPALQLYTSVGFQRVGLRKGYYAKTNENAVVMFRNLDEPEAEAPDPPV
jgi:ribosomal-protein-alanine N-acetyltransferase